MRSALLYGAAAALLGQALASPRPQLIDLDSVVDEPAPEVVVPPVTVVSELIPSTPTSVVAASITADVFSDPAGTDTPSARKHKRAACDPQPTGSGPVSTPDTPEAFSSNQAYADLANNAQTPAEYTLLFSNQAGSSSGSGYIGLYTLKAYDPAQCRYLCDEVEKCRFFNLYVERDPTLAPAAACPSPPSLTNYKCTLWSVVPGASQLYSNVGQYRTNFVVKIAGSNGYAKNAGPGSAPGFEAPVALPAAINAPLDVDGSDTYIGNKYYPYSVSQGFTPETTCAAACTAQTAYDSQTRDKTTGLYKPCNFFNAYNLLKNGVPQGLYCSLYTKAWDSSYAVNTGQTRGKDVYTVVDSYSYTLSTLDPGYLAP